MKIYKRIISFFLVLFLIVGNFSLRISLSADTKEGGEADNSGLSNPKKPQSADDAWEGSYVNFGTWNKAPLKWRVLNNNGAELLLMTDESVGEYPYRHVDTLPLLSSEHTWEKSTLRSWLNNDFIKAAFNDVEQNALKINVVENGYTASKDFDSGPTTYDKVYILSATEVLNPNYGFWSDADNSKSRAFTGHTNSGQKYSENVWTRTICQQFFDGIYAAWLDKNGKIMIRRGAWDPVTHEKDVHPVIKVPITAVNGEWEDLHGKNTKSAVLTIYENIEKPDSLTSKYILSDGADVDNGNHVVRTHEDGCATITGNWEQVIISKENFSTRTLTNKRLERSKKVYLQPKSNKPVINGVWIDNTDVLHEEFTIDFLESEAVTLEAEIDWGEKNYKTIELAQDGKKAVFTGDTLEMVFKDKFDVSNPIYIRAIDDEGSVTVKKLMISPESYSPIMDLVEGFKLSLGNSISLKLPESFPFVGGEEIGFDISSGTVPITCTIEDGKVKGVIGIAFKEYVDKDNWATSQASGYRSDYLKAETKYAFKVIKSIKESVDDAKKSLQKLKNIKQKYKTAMKYPQGSYVFKTNFTVLGFFEGYVAKDEFKFLDGGVIFNPSVSYGGSGQFFLGEIPCYWEWEIKEEIEAKLNLFRREAAKEFLPFGDIGGELSGSIGAGFGLNKLITIGGGGKLTFKPLVKLAKDLYFSTKVSINAYFKAKLAFLEYKHDFKPIKEWLIEYPKTSTSTTSISDIDKFDYYDIKHYTLQDLNYLDKSSDFNANLNRCSVKEKGSSIKNNTSNVFKTNTYSETSPKLAAFSDGSKIVVWIDSDSSDINAISLYYSYFDGNVWSAPAVVENDGTVDFSPDLVIVDDIAYIVWQDGRKEFSNQDTLETIASDMGITAAVFDRNHQTFQCKDLTETVDGLNMQPKLCGKNGEISAVWLNNKANDWFGLNEENIIIGSKLNGADWQNPEIYYDSRKSINSFSVDYINDQLHIAFCEDSDNNPETTDDLKIYLNGNLVNGVSAGSSPVLDNGTLYWYEDGKIVCQDIDSNEKKIVVDSDNLNTDRFQIISDNLHKALIFAVADGLQNELYAVYQDVETEAWGNPVSLTEEGGFISDYSGIWTGEGLEVFLNKTDITGDYDSENPYGETCLNRLTAVLKPDISVDEVFLDESDIVPGEDIDLNISVTNHGEVAGQCRIHILNSQGEIMQSEMMPGKLLPGCTQEITCYYNVSEDDIGKKITLEAQLVSSDGNTLTDDKPEIMLDYQDIALENTGWGIAHDDSVYIYTTVTNWGYKDSSAVKVCLYENSEQGTMVDSVGLDNVGSLDVKKVSFHVPYEKDKVYYVKVIGMENDDMVSNNQDFVALDESIYTRTQQEGAFSTQIQSIILSVTDASLDAGNTLQLVAEIFPEDAENKTLKWSSSDEQIATVDNNGLVTAVGTGKATITVESQDGSGKSASCVITVTKISDNNFSDDNPSDGTSGSNPSGSIPGNNQSGGSTPGSNPSESKPGDNMPDKKPGDNSSDGLQVKLLYYIVNFDSNGGTNLSRKTMTLLMDDTLGILPKVQRKNYTFKGWYMQKSGGEKVSTSTILNASTTLYAQWTKIAKPAKVKKLALRSTKKRQLKVSFKKVTGAAGYQIDYSANKKFTSSAAKRILTVSKNQTLKKLKTGRKYYVRVRAYKTGAMGEKIYGSYSKIKTIKIK